MSLISDPMVIAAGAAMLSVLALVVAVIAIAVAIGLSGKADTEEYEDVGDYPTPPPQDWRKNVL